LSVELEDGLRKAELLDIILLCIDESYTDLNVIESQLKLILESCGIYNIIYMLQYIDGYGSW